MKRDVTFTLDYNAKDAEGRTKMFKDSCDKSSSRTVSLYTICRSERKARELGKLKIGESYSEGSRSFTRVS